LVNGMSLLRVHDRFFWKRLLDCTFDRKAKESE
jgi:hypothetical protein